jgi:hypothetical protein
MLYGIFTQKIPFLRTPKLKDRESWWFALLLVSEEFTIAVLLWAAAIGVALLPDSDSNDVRLWICAMVIQSLPYTAAVIMSLISSAKPFSHTSTDNSSSAASSAS